MGTAIFVLALVVAFGVFLEGIAAPAFAEARTSKPIGMRLGRVLRDIGFGEALIMAAFAFVFRRPRSIYKPDGRLYLRRFFITPRAWLGPGKWPRVLGWVPTRYRKIFLHRIRLSDDRTMHDHPWPFTSVILAGKYREHVMTDPDTRERWAINTRDHGAGSVLRNPATHVHRLEVIRRLWTLVFAGESVREWGFWLEGDVDGHEWIDWRTFLKLQNEPTPPEDAFEDDPWFPIRETKPLSAYQFEAFSGSLPTFPALFADWVTKYRRRT